MSNKGFAILPQGRGNPSVSVVGAADSIKSAMEGLVKFGEMWQGTKKGRSAKPYADGAELLLYYSDGKLAATVFVEPLSLS